MNMNKFYNKAIAFLLVILLVLGAAPAAFADEVTSTEPSTGIIYKGKSVVDRWFYRDVDTTYTSTDLFKNFKGVMPGDELITQDFIVKNEAKNSIKLFMEVLPHGEGNGLSEGVAQYATTAQSIDFLNQLSMQVVSVSGEQEKVLFDIPANPKNNPDIKGLGTYYGKAELGTIAAGYGAELRVKLNVPITMGNEYALDLANGKGIGEVDFKFTIQENESGGGGGNPPKNPDEEIDDQEPPKGEPDEPIVIPGEPVEDIPDPEVPLGDAPQTGDNTNIAAMIILLLVGAFGLALSRKIKD
ncbi:MAG: LPXTG cell wall anchor domain-containing protein [Peptococcaceae bacterium]|nr:LPXTG cell wall anchor domain-containing protein [Peptococcaceae bacterium]